jgi:hypothetical protein
MSNAEPTMKLLELSASALAIGPAPSAQARLRLGNAVAEVLRLFRLHGLESAPAMSAPQATETFRHALRLALAARVPREKLVLIFNGEEDAAEAARKDLR